jgi:hypothetical protein
MVPEHLLMTMVSQFQVKMQTSLQCQFCLIMSKEFTANKLALNQYKMNTIKFIRNNAPQYP